MATPSPREGIGWAEGLERLSRLIPGVGHYQDREGLRETDKRVRVHLAEKLADLGRTLEETERRLTEAKRLDRLPALDRVARLLNTQADRIRFASYGFAGVFDLHKMNPFRPGGVLFRFPIIHVDRPERGDVLRGFLDSVAFAVRANCEQIATVTGRPANALRASGGMVASPTLVHLLANTLGTPVEVATVPETASLGCAILLAAGAGLHPSLGDAVVAMTARTRVEPEPEATRNTDERYRKWRELYEKLEQCTV